MYKVSFYFSRNEKPIEDFLNNCNETVRAKILKQLNYIQEFGLTPAIPNLRKLSGTPLWELRILGHDNIRIICKNEPSKKITILHIFSKKKQKTPQKELSIALKRFHNLTPDI